VVVVVLPSLVSAEQIGQGGTSIDWRRVSGLAGGVGIDMVLIRPFGVAGFGLVVWMV